MIKTVKQACRLIPIVRDYRMSHGVENLAQLIHDERDGSDIFSRNFATHDMEQLFRERPLRLHRVRPDRKRRRPLGAVENHLAAIVEVHQP